jgi:hypothetical protein
MFGMTVCPMYYEIFLLIYLLLGQVQKSGTGQSFLLLKRKYFFDQIKVMLITAIHNKTNPSVFSKCWLCQNRPSIYS